MNYFLFFLFFLFNQTQTYSNVFRIKNSDVIKPSQSNHSPIFIEASKKKHTQHPFNHQDTLLQQVIQKQQYYNPSILPEDDPYHPDYSKLQSKKHDITMFGELSSQQEKQPSQLYQKISHLSRKAYSLPNYKEIKYLKNEILDSCSLAHLTEQQGAKKLAARLFNWGNSLFKCAKAVAQGIKNGTLNSINAYLHPIKTLQDIALSVVEAGKALALLTRECMIISHYNDMGRYDLLEKKYLSYDQNIAHLGSYLSSFSKEEILQKATALGVEAILLHKIIGSVAKFTKYSSEKLVTFIETTSENSEFVCAVEGIPFKISVTTADYLKAMAVEGEAAIPKLRSNISKSFQGKAIKWVPLEVNLSYLKSRFDFIETGWGLLEGTKLSGGYNHILRGISFSRNGKLLNISGFHHDILETIVNKLKKLQGVSLEVVSKKNGTGGIYKILFKGHNNRRIPKTFFPSTWTHEQVFEKIYEAIKYAKKNNIPFEIDNNYFKCISYTKENIKINLVFNQEGVLVTAHPLIK